MYIYMYNPRYIYIYIFTKNIRFNDFFLSPQGSGRSPSYHQSSEPKRRGKVPRDGGKASAAAQIFPRFFCFRIVFLSFNFGQVEDSQTVQENHNKHNVLGNSLQGNHPIFGGCSADMWRKNWGNAESQAPKLCTAEANLFTGWICLEFLELEP